ncbi:MAG TPA: protein kinase [Polyangiaceae bacterium]
MDSPVKVGEVLADKYKVEKVLGSGAMGVVVSARHVDLQQLVALKFMLPTSLPDQAAGDRFLREAQAAGRLRGEHVARVMDFGRLQGGAPYIVMEFLEGEDLEKILDREGPFPIATAVNYLLQACAGMAEAHAQGIVHRDLKPQNLFLTERPDGTPLVKVLDFGISKLQGDVSSVTATQSTTVMGSPAYMSPEQARSAKHVDHRGDIYSLGAILYQIIAGRLPFQAESVAGMLVAIVSEPPTPLREYAPSVPPELEAVVMKCLEKKRDDRPQSVKELAQLLAPFADGQRISAFEADRTALSTDPNPVAEKANLVSSAKEVVVTTMQPSSRSAERSGESAPPTVPSKKKSPVPLAAIIGVVVALPIAALVFLKTGTPPTQDPAAATSVASGTTAPPAQSSAAVNAPPPITEPSAAPSAASAAAPTPEPTQVAAPRPTERPTGVSRPKDAGSAHVAAPTPSAKPSASVAPKPNPGGLFDRPE